MDLHNPRKYGKRSTIKRKQESMSPSGPGRLVRRKISPPTTVTRSPSPSQITVVTDTEEDENEHRQAHKPTPGSPNSKKVAKSDLVSPGPVLTQATQDLTGFLDAMLSPSSTVASPTKLAKRMLARSKTESSIDNSERSSGIERTPSLPTLSPSSSKAREIPNRPSSSMAPMLPILPPAKSTTKTYAGKFRSFLVTLPSSNSQTPNAEEEFESRESYSSLRTRWNVDNSEDDPYPTLPSPAKSKSNSATPDMSPFRSGKGKLKASNSVRVPPLSYGMANPLKSISELRNKGESRRFLDEVGYLFEGMDGQGGIGLRRASALEIVTKLCDSDFARKAKAADFFTRTWDLFIEAGAGKGQDKILDILLIFFVALVARDPPSLAELAQRSISPPPSPSISAKNAVPKPVQDISFFAVLFRISSANLPSSDPLMSITPSSAATDLDLKNMGLNKKDRNLLSTIYNTISSKSNLFPEGTTISSSLVISFSLQALPPHTIPAIYFPAFLQSFRSSLSPSTPKSLSSLLASRWLAVAKTVHYLTVYYHLRLFDSYLLDQWEVDEVYLQRNVQEMIKAREEWLADDLGAFGVCIELAAKNAISEPFPTRQYLDTTLRVLVALTHLDKAWGTKVVQGDYLPSLLLRTVHDTGSAMQSAKVPAVKKEYGDDALASEDTTGIPQESDAQALDTLCLTLGLLTNLVQSVPETKDIVREIRINPSCPLAKRECGRKCSCKNRVSAIKILVDLYAQQQIKLESASAVLALEGEDSPEAHAEADASFLRGHLAVLFGLLMTDTVSNEAVILSALPGTTTRMKLTRLVEQAKDFAAFYTAVSSNIGEDKESAVASDVVRFLEGLRDASS